MKYFNLEITTQPMFVIIKCIEVPSFDLRLGRHNLTYLSIKIDFFNLTKMLLIVMNNIDLLLCSIKRSRKFVFIVVGSRNAEEFSASQLNFSSPLISAFKYNSSL